MALTLGRPPVGGSLIAPSPGTGATDCTWWSLARRTSPPACTPPLPDAHARVCAAAATQTSAVGVNLVGDPYPVPAPSRLTHYTGWPATGGRPPMEGAPSRCDQRTPVCDAAVERQPPRAPVVVALTDLPDDLLLVVAEHVAAVRGKFCVRELLPWLRTSRRLAAVGYCAVPRVTLTPRLDRCLRPPRAAGDGQSAAAPGEQTDPRLASLLAFLGRARHVRDAVLRPSACCGRHERELAAGWRAWWLAVLPALSRLPLRSLTAHGTAVAALADAPAAAVPLRTLGLGAVDRHDAGHLRGATLMLARYRQSLQALGLHTVSNTGTSAADAADAWSVASLVGCVGNLPALTSLSLHGITAADAAAVAVACPALESLTMKGKEARDEQVWGCWAFPQALPRLSSLLCTARVHGPGLAFMLRGRRLRLLGVRARRPGHLLGGDLLRAAAALPEKLIIDGMACSRSLLERLTDGPAERGTLRELSLTVADLSAATLSPLSRLTGLTHLSLSVDEMPASVSWPSLPGLTKLSVSHVRGQDWASSLLTALALSPTRHSLHVLCLEVASSASIPDAAVAAAAPQLTALRQLQIVGRREWTFARGSIVGVGSLTKRRRG